MGRVGRELRVLPDGERVEEAMRIAASSGEGFVDGSAFLHWEGLLGKLQGPRWLKRRPCSRETSRSVVGALVRELGPGPFGSFAQEPAFVRAVHGLFSDLKAGGLPPLGFSNAVGSLPEPRVPRALHLSRLYGAYEERLASLGLADAEDGLRGSRERLRKEGLPVFFRRFTGISLAFFYDFPPLVLELLLALAEACEGAGLTLRLEVPAAGAAPVDSLVDGALAVLERQAQELTALEVVKEDFLLEGRPYAALGARLFAAPRPLDLPQPGGSLDDALAAPAPVLLSAAQAQEEVKVLARRVRQLLDEGTAPEQVVVAFRSLDVEEAALREALDELGVCSRGSVGSALLSRPSVRVLAELPLLAEEHFPADGVAQLFSSSAFPLLSCGAPEAPRSLLARAAVRDDGWGAKGGKGGYEVRLEALAQRLQRRGNPGDVPRVRALLGRCLRLFALGRALPAQGTLQELLAGWWAWVEGLGFPGTPGPVARTQGESTAVGRAALQSLALDEQAAGVLRGLVDQWRAGLALSGAGSQRMTRRLFHRWLLDALSEVRLPAHGPPAGAVQLLELSKLPGRSFKHVLLGGMSEGRFPGRAPQQLIFPDDDRVCVNRHQKRDVFRVQSGEGEGRPGFRLAEDRLLFYLALCSSTSGVTLTCPRAGPGGQEAGVSPFLEELSLWTGVAQVALPLRAITPLEEVRTETELRERVALELLANPLLRVSEKTPLPPRVRDQLSAEPWLGAARELVTIEEERLRFFSNPGLEAGRFSGRLEGSGLAQALAQAFSFGPGNPLSASALGRFGNCSFQGLLSQVLGLKEREEHGEDLDARGKGSFWHRVLERLFPLLQREGLLGKPLEEIPAALLEEALSRAAADTEALGHVGHPLLWKVGRQRAEAMVRRLLSSEHRGLPFSQQTPRHTELSFGRPDSPEGWREVVIPGGPGEEDVYLEGKIDRLDEGGGSLAVVDYKSGALGTKPELREKLLNTEFQLPLYLLAARLSGHQGPLSAAWLSLKSGAPLSLGDLLAEDGDASLEQLLATDPQARQAAADKGGKNLANAVHSLLSRLRGGEFPMRPADCTLCGYRSVCRISDRRLVEEGT